MQAKHNQPSCYFIKDQLIFKSFRGVAQPGSALAWGASGRRFKSFRPDQSQQGFLLFPIAGKNILGVLLGVFTKKSMNAQVRAYLENICPCFGLVLVERFTQRRYLACATKLDRGNSTVIRQTVLPCTAGF